MTSLPRLKLAKKTKHSAVSSPVPVSLLYSELIGTSLGLSQSWLYIIMCTEQGPDAVTILHARNSCSRM